MTEKTIEKKLREQVAISGGMAVKFFCLSFTGMPDRIVLMPGGQIWFVELKSPGKSPSPRQRIVMQTLKSLGFSVLLIDSEETLSEFFKTIK